MLLLQTCGVKIDSDLSLMLILLHGAMSEIICGIVSMKRDLTHVFFQDFKFLDIVEV